MANELYGLGRQAFGDGLISWSSDNIKTILVDSALYTVAIDTDQFLSDVAGAAIKSTSANLLSKANLLGICNAGTATYTAVPSGDPCELVIIYQDTGDSATSRLIAKIDTATNLPVTPNGGDIEVQWDTGVDKIFKL
jgi:hypothetical protein